VKSQGLQLDDSQVASAERLVKLAAVATKAACIDIQLTQERDGKDRLPASNVFTEPEIDTLAALGPTLEGNTDRQRNPHPPQSLARAAWSIARLGGWNPLERDVFGRIATCPVVPDARRARAATRLAPCEPCDPGSRRRLRRALDPGSPLRSGRDNSQMGDRIKRHPALAGREG